VVERAGGDDEVEGARRERERDGVRLGQERARTEPGAGDREHCMAQVCAREERAGPDSRDIEEQGPGSAAHVENPAGGG
jgi:hypothetical protein